MLNEIKKLLPRDKNKRFAVILIALLALPISVVLVQRVVRYFSGAASASVYFEPATTDLPPDKTLRLMVNSGSTQVGFARVEVNFNTSDLQLTNEVSTTNMNMLTMNNNDVTDPGSLPTDACSGTQECIIKTPMNAANNSGKIILVLAKDPRDAGIAPSGIFELASFTFTSNTSAQINSVVSVASNQLVDLNADVFGVTVTNATLSLNGGGEVTPTPQGGLIDNLQVNDGRAWNVMTNLQTQGNGGETQYSDRAWYFSSVPSSVAGSSWIQTANASKSYTGASLASFTLGRDATVYIAHDDRITSKPSWLSSGWTDSGSDLVNAESTPRSFSLYSRNYSTGETVSLGQNGSSSFGMYTVVVVFSDVITATPTNLPTNTPTDPPSTGTMPVTPTPGECSSVPGDVNNDGKVSVLDIIKVVAAYQTSPPSDPCADLNGDDKVTVLDIIIVVANYP